MPCGLSWMRIGAIQPVKGHAQRRERFRGALAAADAADAVRE